MVQKWAKNSQEQLFLAHFESIFCKNKVLFQREFKKHVPKGIKQVLFPRPFLNMKQKISKNGSKFGLKSPKMGK